MIDYEGGAPVNGISALIKETPESFLASSTRQSYNERTSVYEPKSWYTPDTDSAGTKTLDFPVSKTVRNTFLVFIITQYLVFCYISPKRIKTMTEWINE